MTDFSIPPTGDTTAEIPQPDLTPAYPPFMALVFFRHDGSRDYYRYDCFTLDQATTWSKAIYSACDATAESAVVYEFFKGADGKPHSVERWRNPRLDAQRGGSEAG